MREALETQETTVTTVHAEPPRPVPGEGFLPRWEAGRPLELLLWAAEKGGGATSAPRDGGRP